jgi:hypothetical protein
MRAGFGAGCPMAHACHGRGRARGALLDLFSGLFCVARNPVHKSPRRGKGDTARPGGSRSIVLAPACTPVDPAPRHRNVANALPRCCGATLSTPQIMMRAGGQYGASQCECGNGCRGHGRAYPGGRRDARRSARRRCPGRPVTILIHGYRFCPSSAAHDPHRHILSLTPRRDCWKAVSWPRHLHLDRPGTGSASVSAGPPGGLCRAWPGAPMTGRGLGRMIDGHPPGSALTSRSISSPIRWARAWR